MIDVTKEQIKEVLERLRGYSYWMYFTPEGIATLTKQIVEIEGQKLYLDILENGNIEATLLPQGEKCQYQVSIDNMVATRKDSLDNLRFSSRMGGCSEEYKKIFVAIGNSYVLSLFQRSVAFMFFSRIQDVSINGIVDALALAVKK